MRRPLIFAFLMLSVTFAFLGGRHLYPDLCRRGHRQKPGLGRLDRLITSVCGTFRFVSLGFLADAKCLTKSWDCRGKVPTAPRAKNFGGRQEGGVPTSRRSRVPTPSRTVPPRRAVGSLLHHVDPRRFACSPRDVIAQLPRQELYFRLTF
jgi:hypothetical protein